MTATAHADPQRARDLAAIHTAKKQLGLDDDVYRDLLEGLTGKRSAGDLDAAERAKVIEHLRSVGFAAKHAPSPKSKNFVFHAKKEHRLIAALWRDLWLLGEVEDAGPRALDHFVQRQAKVAALRWLAPEAAAAVVQALKDWLARAGFDLPSTKSKDVKKLALVRLVEAQWLRLEQLGALTFKNDNHRKCALDSYFDRGIATCSKGVRHPMTTAAELDKCAELLGAWIRSQRKRTAGGQAEASPDGATPSPSTERQ